MGASGTRNISRTAVRERLAARLWRRHAAARVAMHRANQAWASGELRRRYDGLRERRWRRADAALVAADQEAEMRAAGQRVTWLARRRLRGQARRDLAALGLRAHGPGY